MTDSVIYLESMSSDDIVRIRDADHSILYKMACHLNKEKEKVIKRAKLFPYLANKYYKIPHTNREYIVQVVVMSKESAKKNSIYYNYYPLIRTSRGLVMMETILGSTATLQFTPHFFSRYVERMADTLPTLGTLSRIDVIRTYLKRNALRPLKAQWKERKGKEEMEIFVNDGGIMVQIDDEKNMAIVKTFVPDDYFYQAQRERSAESHVVTECELSTQLYLNNHKRGFRWTL